MPRVSVLVSCYNAADYLQEAVESILTQTYSDYELLLINDGSTDDTLRIIEEYAQQDSRVSVLDKENTGLADSLNAGLKIAKGEWIARLDVDDIALPDRLARQVAFTRADTSIVLLGSNCVLVDQCGGRIGSYRYPKEHGSLVNHIAVGRSPFPHSSAFFHRKTANGLGGYNPRFVRCQDADLWLRLSETGTIACLPEPLVKIRKHSSNISFSSSLAIIMGMAVRVCHSVRSTGAPDPAQGDDDVWTQFTRWLSRRLEEESYIELQEEWSRIRREFYSSSGTGGWLCGTSTLIRRLLTSAYCHQIILSKLFGTKIISQLAGEWIKNDGRT